MNTEGKYRLGDCAFRDECVVLEPDVLIIKSKVFFFFNKI